MKKYVYLVLLLCVVYACKKESTSSAAPKRWLPAVSYMNTIKNYLKENIADSDYVKVDFDNSIISKQPAGWFLRIAFFHQFIARDFILLQTDSVGNVGAGKFVHIVRDETNPKVFNGTVTTESISHTEKQQTTIANGVLQRTNISVKENDDSKLPPDVCYDCLPEVVVVGYAPSSGSGSGGISYADYLLLSALIGNSTPVITTGSTYSGIYSSSTGGTTGGSGSASPGSKSGYVPPKPSPDVIINYEASTTRTAIDVNAYMNAFSTIADAGSTCSVTIYTDLPVNDNPSYIFNILTGATGHCFIQLTKTNGTQSVTQIIGKTTSKAIAVLGFPVAGKIVDNTAHKYNASLTMNITPVQLTTEINAIKAIGSNPAYDMWENNCVDYALGILNAVRPGNPLNVGLSIDPSTSEAYQTPQSLYIALQNLKTANGPDAAHITLNVVNNAGTSYGPGK